MKPCVTRLARATQILSRASECSRRYLIGGESGNGRARPGCFSIGALRARGISKGSPKSGQGQLLSKKDYSGIFLMSLGW
jgi:hypothetical protein